MYVDFLIDTKQYVYGFWLIPNLYKWSDISLRECIKGNLPWKGVGVQVGMEKVDSGIKAALTVLQRPAWLWKWLVITVMFFGGPTAPRCLSSQLAPTAAASGSVVSSRPGEVMLRLYSAAWRVWSGHPETLGRVWSDLSLGWRALAASREELQPCSLLLWFSMIPEGWSGFQLQGPTTNLLSMTVWWWACSL